jgi:hypothetical protein
MTKKKKKFEVVALLKIYSDVISKVLQAIEFEYVGFYWVFFYVKV